MGLVFRIIHYIALMYGVCRVNYPRSSCPQVECSVLNYPKITPLFYKPSYTLYQMEFQTLKHQMLVSITYWQQQS